MRADNGFILFTVEHCSNTEKENQQAMSLAKKCLDLDNIPYKEVVGGYTMDNGQVVNEQTILVPMKYEKQVVELALAGKQESILFVYPNRQASLFYLESGKFEKLAGKFKEVSERVALSQPGFTQDVNGKFYSVVG